MSNKKYYLHFVDRTVYCNVQKSPTHIPILRKLNQATRHPLHLRSILILSSCTSLGIPDGPSFNVFLTITLHGHFSIHTT